MVLILISWSRGHAAHWRKEPLPLVDRFRAMVRKSGVHITTKQSSLFLCAFNLSLLHKEAGWS